MASGARLSVGRWDMFACRSGGHLEMIMWVRSTNAVELMHVVTPPLSAGTWRCCIWRGRTAARGISGFVLLRFRAATRDSRMGAQQPV